MAIHVALNHRTGYRYDRSVNLGPHVVRLRPAPHCRTRILSYSLRVTPEKHFINWQQDPQSNFLARLVFQEPSRELLIEVDVVAEMAVYNPFDFFLEPSAETFPFQYDPALDHELEPFRLGSELTPIFKSYLESARAELLKPAHAKKGGLRTIDFLVEINRKLWRDIKYIIRLEPGVQTPEETLKSGKGSCRDSAWLLCQLLRRMGLSARFVSGYLIQLTPDVKSLDGPSGTEKDFTDLHAWCEVYLPGGGWIGLDPTSGLLAGEGHIPLAATPDPQSAAPVSGLVDECETEFSFAMSVRRIHESPRVTKPYSEEQWQEIEALGHRLDEQLERNDCRLTMGGEPTFVSTDDMEGAEWKLLALGPTKRRLADDLLKRLKNKFTTGALLHYGQGKWYPGESLPRWAFGCYWRKDGEPIWLNEELFAHESTDYGFEEKRAEAFVHALATRLGCGGSGSCRPSRTPGITCGANGGCLLMWTRSNPISATRKIGRGWRRFLSKDWRRSLVTCCPCNANRVLPNRPWASGPWFFRPERCYLLPGDSPIGFRLPLDSLPVRQRKRLSVPARGRSFSGTVCSAASPREGPAKVFPEGMDPGIGSRFRPLRQGRSWTWPSGHKASKAAVARIGAGMFRPPARGESASWIARTALCVEPRQGRLHIFMPPTRTLEDYLSVTAAIEDTAELLDTPVILEGYTPPFDPRLHVIKVTPDPGVIEVNIHPAHTWSEMVERTEGLYEEARQSGSGPRNSWWTAAIQGPVAAIIS